MASSLITEVVKIEKIKPHPNADRMDIAIIKGWQLCVAKNGYEVGTEGVYFTIDTMVPKSVAEALDFDKYLSFKKSDPDFGRVRAVNLRGEPSYGVFVPLKVVEYYLAEKHETNNFDLYVGNNVVDILGCKKYEPPLKLNSQDAEKDHDLFDKYTDIENMRNFPNVIIDGDEVVVTEKIHGTNSRHSLIEGEYMVGSHTIRLKQSETNRYWYVFNDNMKELLTSLSKEFKAKQVIMYGEIFGPGVQSGYTYDIPQGKLGYRCFDIKVDGKYLDWDKFLSSCNSHNISTVPVLYSGPLCMSNIINTFGVGPSTLSNHNLIEGVVVKLVKEELRSYGSCFKRAILKYVFDQFLTGKNTNFH